MNQDCIGVEQFSSFRWCQTNTHFVHAHGLLRMWSLHALHRGRRSERPYDLMFQEARFHLDLLSGFFFCLVLWLIVRISSFVKWAPVSCDRNNGLNQLYQNWRSANHSRSFLPWSSHLSTIEMAPQVRTPRNCLLLETATRSAGDTVHIAWLRDSAIGNSYTNSWNS